MRSAGNMGNTFIHIHLYIYIITHYSRFEKGIFINFDKFTNLLHFVNYIAYYTLLIILPHNAEKLKDMLKTT